MHKYTNDGMRSHTPSIPIAVSTLSTQMFPACNANAVEGTRNCLHTPDCVCRSPSMALSSLRTTAEQGAAPGMQRKQVDRLRIVLLPVTVEDIPIGISGRPAA